MFRISLARIGVVVAVIALTCSTRAWARQGPPQPPAQLSPIDVVASVPWTQVTATAGAQQHWAGPGFSVAVNGNVSDNAALATSVEKSSHGTLAVLGGVQMSTGFFYGSGRDPVPGRFFAKLLAGVSSGASVQTRGIGQVDVGFEILTTLKPVGVHVEVGYDIVPGDPVHHAYGRMAVGVIFGAGLR
jgi:hypothetical protein